MRKLYRLIRKTLKIKTSIKVYLESGSLKKEIPKSDEKMGTVGISNNCQLYVIVEQCADVFKVILNFGPPVGIRSIEIAEVIGLAVVFKDYYCH